MKIIAIANKKGGCGKSTIAVHVSTNVAKRDHYVVLMDLDPIANSTKWWDKRESGDPDLLQIPIDQLEAAIPKLEAAGVEFLFIDTPGFEHHDITAVLELADLILVPSKPGPFDLWTTVDGLVVLETVSTPKVFVLNEVHSSTNISQDAVIALSGVGKLGPTIHWKADFMGCLSDGRTIDEVNPRNFGCTEITALTDFLLINAGVHVQNPVVIDPHTRKVQKVKVVKKPSKHAPIQLDDASPVEASTQGLKLVRDRAAG